MKLLDWFRSLAPDKSVLAYKALSEAPDDDPGLFYPAGHPQEGQSRRARVTRFPEPDKAKLQMLKRKADVVRMADRRQG
jgi:hypothetical protein